MQSDLTTTTGSGTQTNTDSPQSASQGSGYSAPRTSLQSDGSVNGFTALRSNSGVSLQTPTLPSVNLGPASSTAVAKHAPPSPKHHVNGALLGIAVLLFIAAALIFAQTFRMANNTTE